MTEQSRGKSRSTALWLASFGAGAGLAGCAGPTTPFGAVSSLSPADIQRSLVRSFAALSRTQHPELSDVSIQFVPRRQVFHDATTFKVVIRDEIPIGDNFRLSLRYNGLDVTKNFMLASTQSFSKNRKNLSIRFRGLKLAPEKDHSIQVTYSRGDSNSEFNVVYEAPRCEMSQLKRIKSLAPFIVPVEWVHIIQDQALQVGINPGLIAGLVAQESGFNPRALSWAKALGLTQITPLTDLELTEAHSDWPRFSGVAEFSFPRLKALLVSGKINSSDDWRLDPSKSVEGTLTYMAKLREYWVMKTHYADIAKNFGNPEQSLSEILLASYNVGPSRVNRAIKKYGGDFLEASEFEAVKIYVKRIQSFCDQFTSERIENEDAT